MVLQQAIDVLKTEARGIMGLIDRIDDSFVKTVDLICNSKGRLIVSGIGKSGIVGRKIVATLNSTGTRSLFLHPVEAMHGDLGMVCKEDILIALSNSGETDELNIMVPSIRGIGCTIIAFTGVKHSTLAGHSDLIIDVGVAEEACSMGIVPTASTTAMLAMGDALAVVLINKKHFKESDFKRYHPGGMLGQRLSMSVNDMMITGNAVPVVPEGSTIQEAVAEINRAGLGVVLIARPDNRLSGIITDGDLRRCIARGKPVAQLGIEEIMTPEPRTLGIRVPAFDALNLMEKYEITVLPIIDRDGKIQGVLHLHDILGKGEFKFNGN
ncbi:MAG: arabinose-5-phosphate isomerase [Desulfobacteraceae bacterium 4572_123]|nr:MAG: arabinose-5-phosphate isomerase [Desulfobacteraceae bacterium 4572_123]